VKDPLFVLGAPRTGTSLLCRALALHPEAVLAHGPGLDGGLDRGLDMGRDAGASTVVSTWSGHNRRVEALDATFPECRFVVMSRDWQAAARSLAAAAWWPDTDLWWYGGTPRDWESCGRDPLELAARHWVREVEAIETGLAAVAPERVHRLSHEDLVRAPVARLRETAVFGGLSDDPGWRAQLGRVLFPDENRAATSVLDGRVELAQDRTTRSLGHPA
jgi:Sulfotransferase family